MLAHKLLWWLYVIEGISAVDVLGLIATVDDTAFIIRRDCYSVREPKWMIYILTILLWKWLLCHMYMRANLMVTLYDLSIALCILSVHTVTVS
jgi:hypothetical protein